MKWSELKALVEAEIEKYSLNDPHIASVDLDYYVSGGATVRTAEISMRDSVESKETYVVFARQEIATNDLG